MFVFGIGICIGGVAAGREVGAGIRIGTGGRSGRVAGVERHAAYRQRAVIRRVLVGCSVIGLGVIRGCFIALEAQLGLKFTEVLEFGQRRQFIQPGQAEVIEEAPGGAEQLRSAGHVAVADHADPLPLFQGADDVAVHGHAAHLLDLAAGDRLSIGDQGQGFQGGAGVAGLAFGPQPGHPGVDVGLDLEAPAAGHLHQFHAALLAVGLEEFKRLFDAVVGCRLVERKQPAQLHHGQRLAGGEQGGLDDAVDQ